jgi:phosphinothricin acetyltransferase
MEITTEEGAALRLAGPADVARITAIYAHYVRTHTATFELDPPDEAEMAARMRSIVEAGLPYWVAETMGAVAGYCYVGPYRPRPAYRFTVENSVYVAPEHVGRGLGTALLARTIADCVSLGLREIVAVIGDSANEASIRLHRSAGFVHVGTLRDVGFKFERWLDTVIMQRSLATTRLDSLAASPWIR